MKMKCRPVLRDIVLFVVGVGGVLFETFCRTRADYGMLPVFMSMIGLPALFRLKGGDDDDDSPSPASLTVPHPLPYHPRPMPRLAPTS